MEKEKKYRAFYEQIRNRQRQDKTMDQSLVTALEHLFSKIDKDHNGVIDKNEFRNLIKLIGEDKFDPNEIKMLFGLIDQNEDGEIELKEFIKGIQNMQKL